MTSLHTLQDRFLDYLRTANPEIGNDIAGDTDEECARRLSIYYNAYRVRLKSSIEIDHPVLGIYLGDDGFDQLAAAYIEAHPSAETSLRHFCDKLPVFLATQTPYASLGVLSDLAGFERCLMDVFDAADAGLIDFDFAATLPADRWPGLTLRFHPSVRMYTTPWNCVEVWQAIKAERTPPEALQAEERRWLVWRNRQRLTEFRSIEADEFTVLSTLSEGQTFAAACEALLQWHAETDVAARALMLLQEWFQAGLVAGSNQ